MAARFALMASDSCAAVAAQIAASCRPVAAEITNDFRRDRAAMLAMAGALKLQATSVDRSVLDALDYVREFTVNGLRLVVPKWTINAGPGPRDHLGRFRSST
jgi:hypothetical protein